MPCYQTHIPAIQLKAVARGSKKALGRGRVTEIGNNLEAVDEQHVGSDWGVLMELLPRHVLSRCAHFVVKLRPLCAEKHWLEILSF